MWRGVAGAFQLLNCEFSEWRLQLLPKLIG